MLYHSRKQDSILSVKTHVLPTYVQIVNILVQIHR